MRVCSVPQALTLPQVVIDDEEVGVDNDDIGSLQSDNSKDELVRVAASVTSTPAAIGGRRPGQAAPKCATERRNPESD